MQTAVRTDVAEVPRPAAAPNGRGAPKKRHLVRSILIVVSLLLVLASAPFAWVNIATAPYRYRLPAQVPHRRVGIVFGAGIFSDGTPMPFLQHRLDTAIQLYKTGKIDKLLVTGDNGTRYHDETSAMKRYAVAQGVPAADITLDYAGFDTYDSCFRAKAIFGVEAATLVTQGYHLPRAVYTCRALGVDAIGVGPSEWQRRPKDMLYYLGREYLADWKALWDVHVSHRNPHFLGPRQVIR